MDLRVQHLPDDHVVISNGFRPPDRRGIPRPVLLVLVASALAVFIAPVVYCLNLYYCLTLIPKEDEVFYPSRFDRWFGWLSVAVVTGMTLILIFARILKTPLFGA